MCMNIVSMKKWLHWSAALCSLLLLACAVAGCKKPVAGTNADSKLFQSAAPEIKSAWDDGVAAMQTNGYVPAYLGLRQLRAQPGVTQEQKDAINARLKQINTQLGEAAQKGDTSAAEALTEIRNASRMRGR